MTDDPEDVAPDVYPEGTPEPWNIDDPEDVAPDVYPEEMPDVTGDPVNVEVYEARLDFLEEVWPELQEGNPQRPVVAMEIVSLRRALEHLTEEE